MSALDRLAEYARDMADAEQDESVRGLWIQIAEEIGGYLGGELVSASPTTSASAPLW